MALPPLGGLGFQLLRSIELRSDVNIRLIGITRSGSDVVVTFEAAQGTTYRLERKLNITDTTWQSIPGVNDLTATSNGPAQIVDLGAVNLGKAFYRVNLATILSVTKTGGGAGTVTSSPPGINCGTDCSENYNSNTVVTLTAMPGGGSTFSGWGGACSGTGTCEVTMDAPKSVSATFTTCSTGSMTFNFTGTVASFTVPACVTTIHIDASGAQGGIGGSTAVSTVAGKGAQMTGDFAVAGGTVLSVLVGEKGQDKGRPGGYNGGGGGGSFVWQTANQTLLIAAGGGGGGGGVNDTITPAHNGIDAVTTANGTNGSGLTSGGGVNGNGSTTPAYSPPLTHNAAGGAGWLSDGAPGFANSLCIPFAGAGQRPLAGGAGGAAGYNGVTLGRGGFGGGGGAQGNCGAGGGGGGGGYSGGGGGASGTSGVAYKGGGGGGSFNGGTLQSNTPGSRVGNGLVIITW